MALPILSRRRIRNKHLELEVLTRGGLRIVALRLLPSRQNLLAEATDIHWPTPYGEYYLLGGHRLWSAPEIPERTYEPESAEILVENIEDGLRLIAPPSAITGLQKSICIRLDHSRPLLRLTHSLLNTGDSLVETAPWAITALPLGGKVILPQPVGPMDSFQPNRHLVLWPYTRINDARLSLADDFIVLHAQADMPPCKIGYFNTHGWIGYLNRGVLFVKRFDVYFDQPHADRGCNVEVYCNNRLIEMETLGRLAQLKPGEEICHTEQWEIYCPDRLPQEFTCLPTE